MSMEKEELLSLYASIFAYFGVFVLQLLFVPVLRPHPAEITVSGGRRWSRALLYFSAFGRLICFHILLSLLSSLVIWHFTSVPTGWARLTLLSVPLSLFLHFFAAVVAVVLREPKVFAPTASAVVSGLAAPATPLPGSLYVLPSTQKTSLAKLPGRLPRLPRPRAPARAQALHAASVAATTNVTSVLTPELLTNLTKIVGNSALNVAGSLMRRSPTILTQPLTAKLEVTGTTTLDAAAAAQNVLDGLAGLAGAPPRAHAAPALLASGPAANLLTERAVTAFSSAETLNRRREQALQPPRTPATGTGTKAKAAKKRGFMANLGRQIWTDLRSFGHIITGFVLNGEVINNLVDKTITDAHFVSYFLGVNDIDLATRVITARTIGCRDLGPEIDIRTPSRLCFWLARNLARLPPVAWLVRAVNDVLIGRNWASVLQAADTAEVLALVSSKAALIAPVNAKAISKVLQGSAQIFEMAAQNIDRANGIRIAAEQLICPLLTEATATAAAATVAFAAQQISDQIRLK